MVSIVETLPDQVVKQIGALKIYTIKNSFARHGVVLTSINDAGLKKKK